MTEQERKEFADWLDSPQSEFPLALELIKASNDGGLFLEQKEKTDDLYVQLTIEGTEYENVEVFITKPDRTIKEQIDRIIDVFKLPRYYVDGITTRRYLLGVFEDDDEDPVILEYENEEGQQKTLLDYDIKSGNHLCLLAEILYGCPIPTEIDNVETQDVTESEKHKEIGGKREREMPWRHILYGCFF